MSIDRIYNNLKQQIQRSGVSIDESRLKQLDTYIMLQEVVIELV